MPSPRTISGHLCWVFQRIQVPSGAALGDALQALPDHADAGRIAELAPAAKWGPGCTFGGAGTITFSSSGEVSPAGRDLEAAGVRPSRSRSSTRSFDLFQPLTYDVPSGALSPGEIAYALRTTSANATSASCLAEVGDFDLDARELHLRP